MDVASQCKRVYLEVDSTHSSMASSSELALYLEYQSVKAFLVSVKYNSPIFTAFFFFWPSKTLAGLVLQFSILDAGGGCMEL